MPEIQKQIEEALNAEKNLKSQGIRQPTDHLTDALQRLKSLESALDRQISQWEYNLGEHSDFLAALNRFSQWIDRKSQTVRDLRTDPLVRRLQATEGARAQMENMKVQGTKFMETSATQLEEILDHTGPGGKIKLNEDYANVKMRWNALEKSIDRYLEQTAPRQGTTRLKIEGGGS